MHSPRYPDAPYFCVHSSYVPPLFMHSPASKHTLGPLRPPIFVRPCVYRCRIHLPTSLQARSELGDAYPTTPRVVASGEYLTLLGKQ